MDNYHPIEEPYVNNPEMQKPSDDFFKGLADNRNIMHARWLAEEFRKYMTGNDEEKERKQNALRHCLAACLECKDRWGDPGTKLEPDMIGSDGINYHTVPDEDNPVSLDEATEQVRGLGGLFETLEDVAAIFGGKDEPPEEDAIDEHNNEIGLWCCGRTDITCIQCCWKSLQEDLLNLEKPSCYKKKYSNINYKLIGYDNTSSSGVQDM